MAPPTTLFNLVDHRPLSWLVPETLRGTSTVEEQRARLLVLASVTTAMLGPLFALIFWLIGSPWMAVPLLVASLVMLTPPLILRRTTSFTAVGNWFAFQAYVALFVMVWMSGGTRPESLVWLFFPPVVAMVFAGTRSGGAWTAICVATCGLFLGLDLSGVDFPDLINNGDAAVAIGGPAALIALNSLCFLLHSQLQIWLVESLEDAQHDALAASHQSFRTLVEHSPDALVVLRKEGSPVYVNPAACEMLGVSEREMMDLDPRRIMPGDEFDNLERLRAELGQDEHVDVEYESTRKRSDGSQIDVEVRNFFTSFQGEPALFLRMRDVTERKQMQAQMMRMDRMIAVGTLAAGVAHEINNPLAFVTGNATLLLTEHANGAFESWEPSEGSTLDHDELREILEDVTEGAERIRRIVSGLRSFARVDQDDQPAAVDLTELLDSVLKMAQHEIKHRARLVKELGELPPVIGDNAGLGQVFLNLVINAAHAIPSGDRDDHQIDVRAQQVGDTVCVTVSDTGDGIPDQIKARIFDPFFTTKATDDGMGLGLYITQSIVRDHGGEITFESTLGAGTTFKVYLPVSTQKPADISGVLPAAPPRADSAKLLIVDDEPNILRTLQRALPGFDVTTTPSAEGAIEQLRQRGPFDLVLCDLLMPQMSGMKFFTHLEEEFEALASRVIFMTGGTFTEEARAFVESTGRPVVEKPFDIQKLRETLAEELELGMV